MYESFFQLKQRPFASAPRVDRYFDRAWRRDEERSAIGYELDRSGIYGGFHCYVRR